MCNLGFLFRIKTAAVLCEQYNSKNGCQGCKDFHLCKHLISGGCTYGSKCVWPHKLWGIPHNEKVLRLNGLGHLQDTHVMQVNNIGCRGRVDKSTELKL